MAAGIHGGWWSRIDEGGEQQQRIGWMGCNGTGRMEKLLEEGNWNLGRNLEVQVSPERGTALGEVLEEGNQTVRGSFRRTVGER